MSQGQSFEVRFWQMVDKTEPNECWNWTGYRNRAGYGSIYYSGASTPIQAHRASLIVHGIELIKGLTVDHLCRNTSCVNPKHLEQVTSKENSLRGFSPPAIYARKTECNNGHAFTKKNTYIYRTGQRKCRKCRANQERARQRRLKEINK